MIEIEYKQSFFQERNEEKINSDVFVSKLEQFVAGENDLIKEILPAYRRSMLLLFLYAGVSTMCVVYTYLDALMGDWFFIMWSLLACVNVYVFYEGRDTCRHLREQIKNAEERKALLTECVKLVKNKESKDKIYLTLDKVWNAVMRASKEQKKEGEKTCKSQ